MTPMIFLNGTAILPDRLLPEAMVICRKGKIDAVTTARGVQVPRDADVVDARGGDILGPGALFVRYFAGAFVEGSRNSVAGRRRLFSPNPNMKNPSKLVLALAILSLPLLAGGCIAAIGNGETPKSNGTVGQQLIDLQKAKDLGAMTDAEYQKQREKVLGTKSK